MPDNLKERGPKDRNCVNASEDWDLKYWSEKFGVDVADLKNAVDIVGPMVSDIEAYFNRTLDSRFHADSARPKSPH